MVEVEYVEVKSLYRVRWMTTGGTGVCVCVYYCSTYYKAVREGQVS